MIGSIDDIRTFVGALRAALDRPDFNAEERAAGRMIADLVESKLVRNWVASRIAPGLNSVLGRMSDTLAEMGRKLGAINGVPGHVDERTAAGLFGRSGRGAS